jgi:hypothetical protein
MEDKITDFLNKANSVGVTIKNRNNLDVVFHAVRADDTSLLDPHNPLIRFDGLWINVSSSSPFVIDSDNISIRVRDIDNWSEIEDPRG